MSADPAIRVHAIMLGVTDIERSKAFYTEKLGFALQGAFGDFAFVDAGGTMLDLSAQLARTRPGGAPEPVEIVLGVDGVTAAYDRFREREVAFLNEPHQIDAANHGANFEDPDGHLFSLYGPL